MNFSIEQSHIPTAAASLMDERMQQAHAYYAGRKLAEIRADMPLLQQAPVEGASAYAQLLGRGGENNRAIVMPLPIANDWGTNMAIRTGLLRSAMPDGPRIIVFPNNSLHDRHVYDLTDAERQKIAKGDFAPVAEKQFRTLDALGVTEVQYFGYSQGGSVGAAALRLVAEKGHFKAGASGLYEAPNAIDRTGKQLQRDFMSGGDLNKAVRDAAIPALAESQRARGGLDTLPQYWMFAQFGISTLLRDNRAVQAGFCHDRFADDITVAVERGTTLTVGAGKESRIMPDSAFGPLVQLAAKYPSLQIECVPGYGHEMGDNIVLFGLLARAALER
jgi:hypothetical protein